MKPEQMCKRFLAEDIALKNINHNINLNKQILALTFMKHTLDEVYKTAGKYLTDLIIGVFDKEQSENIPFWFYQPNTALNGKSPFELCNEGHPEELEKKLMDSVTAAQGG